MPARISDFQEQQELTYMRILRGKKDIGEHREAAISGSSLSAPLTPSLQARETSSCRVEISRENMMLSSCSAFSSAGEIKGCVIRSI